MACYVSRRPGIVREKLQLPNGGKSEIDQSHYIFDQTTTTDRVLEKAKSVTGFQICPKARGVWYACVLNRKNISVMVSPPVVSAFNDDGETAGRPVSDLDHDCASQGNSWCAIYISVIQVWRTKAGSFTRCPQRKRLIEDHQ